MEERQEDRVEIGRRLKLVRENLGYSQEKFAESLELGARHYRRLETGDYLLSTRRIITLYKLYKVDPTFLLTGDSPNDDLIAMITNCSNTEKKNRLSKLIKYVENMIKNM